MLVLVAAAAPSLSAFVCDESSGFVRGVQYSQISLTDMCREAPRVCNANPKYGAPNGNARAIAWCEARCERDGASCTAVRVWPADGHAAMLAVTARSQLAAPALPQPAGGDQRSAADYCHNCFCRAVCPPRRRKKFIQSTAALTHSVIQS